MAEHNIESNVGTAPPPRTTHTGPYRHVISARRLTGYRIRNSAREDLGTLEEVMIDVPSGRVAYAVFAFGGFLGVGSKLFAVPWEGLTLDEQHHEFILDVDRQQLEEAPGFDKDQWPDMADAQWGADVYRFYGQKPYWEP